MLHQNELVLTEKETNKFGDLMSAFSNMQNIFNKLGSGFGLGGGETNYNNKLEVYIESFSGTEEDARSLSDRINDEWLRKMRVERGVR